MRTHLYVYFPYQNLIDGELLNNLSYLMFKLNNHYDYDPDYNVLVIGGFIIMIYYFVS